MARWAIVPIIGTGAEGDDQRPDFDGFYDMAIMPADMDESSRNYGKCRHAVCLVRTLSGDAVKDAGADYIELPDRSVVLNGVQRAALVSKVMTLLPDLTDTWTRQDYERGDFHRAIQMHLAPEQRAFVGEV